MNHFTHTVHAYNKDVFGKKRDKLIWLNYNNVCPCDFCGERYPLGMGVYEQKIPDSDDGIHIICAKCLYIWKELRTFVRVRENIKDMNEFRYYSRLDGNDWTHAIRKLIQNIKEKEDKKRGHEISKKKKRRRRKKGTN